jgi:MFS family permease
VLSSWRALLRLPRSTWLVVFAIFVNRIGTMVLPFLAVYLTRELGFTPTTAGFMIAVYGGGAVVSSLLAGRLADRHGAARVVALSLYASGAVLVLYPLATTPLAVGAMTFALALAGEMARPASMVLVADVERHQRKPAFVLLRLAVNLGMSVGPAVGGFLAARWFPGIFIVDGVTSILAAAIFTLSLRRRAPSAPRATARPGSEGPCPRRAYADGPFLHFLAAVFVASLLSLQLEAALPLDLVQGMGLSLEWFGASFTVNTLMILALELPLNHATARWPEPRSLALGALLYGAGLGVLAVLRSLFGLFACVVITTFGEMILMPAMSAYAAEAATPRRSGEYMGMYMGAKAIGFVVGPWGGIFLLERLGPERFWVAMSLCGAAAALLMLTVRGSSTRPEVRHEIDHGALQREDPGETPRGRRGDAGARDEDPARPDPPDRR